MLNILSRLTSWRSSLIGAVLVVGFVGTALTSTATTITALIDGDAATKADWSTVTLAWGAVTFGIKELWHKSSNNPIDGGKK